MEKMTPHSAEANPCDRLFEYEDYRKFLVDSFRYLRETKRVFSYRWIAKKAGFASHSFLEGVLKGKKNLTLESARAVGDALGFSGAQQEYFDALVLQSMATSPGGRERHALQLDRLRRTDLLVQPDPSAWDYFANWQYPVLRELVVHGVWNGDFSTLGRWMKPAMTAVQSQEGVEYLVAHGYLSKTDDKWLQTSPGLTARDIPEVLLRTAKRGFILKALEALEEQPRTQRHVSSSTLAMSHKTFRQASRLLAETRKKILAMAMEDLDVERVYILNLQLFALTDVLRKSARKVG